MAIWESVGMLKIEQTGATRSLKKVPAKEQTKSKESASIKIGPKKLTRFERARVVGARALQISMGAPVIIDVSPELRSPIDIALMELEERVLPMSIRRSLPDGTSQNIPLRLLVDSD